MSVTKVLRKLVVTLAVLAACGPVSEEELAGMPSGGETHPAVEAAREEAPRHAEVPVRFELPTAPRLRPVPLVETSQPSAKQLAVSGVVTLVGGVASVNLDVLVDGASVTNAEVYLHGSKLAFDPAHAGYYAELPEGQLPPAGPLSLDVVHDGVTHTRSLTVPSSLQLVAPDTVPVRTDFQIEWTLASNVTLYRTWLVPIGGFGRGGELSNMTRKYIFNGLLEAGAAELFVSAVARNTGSEPHANIDVVRMERRTVTFVE